MNTPGQRALFNGAGEMPLAKSKSSSGMRANTSFHVGSDIGFVTKPIVQKLESTGDKKTSEALTYQRAFSVSGNMSFNLVHKQESEGTMAELGVIARAGYDAFVDPDKVTEKDGLTYINLGSLNGQQAFSSAQIGVRFRLTQVEQDPNTTKTIPTGTEGSERKLVHPVNLEDLVVAELLYGSNSAFQIGSTSPKKREGLLTFRFFASPEIPNSGGLKGLVGMEVTRDTIGGGSRDIRIFYGANAPLKSLLTGFRGN